jgi:hypothetical protein
MVPSNQVASAPAGSRWDQVATGGPDGRVWTREQFERLPLVDRVRLLASGSLRFYRMGEEVSSRDALRAT